MFTAQPQAPAFVHSRRLRLGGKRLNNGTLKLLSPTYSDVPVSS
jgi:hypothetical protein